jgi:hypothetical protein
LESSLASLIAFLGLGSLTLGVAILLVVLVLAVLPLLYLLPTIVALQRRKQNALSILMVNLYLGWTLIGWVAAIAWAYSVDRDRF